MRRLFSTFALWSGLVFGLWCAPKVAFAADAIDRFVLVVGANDGGAERVHLRYASTDARAFEAVLRDVGGLSTGEVLDQPSVRGMVAALARLARASHSAREAGRRSELVFYFSGHADDRGLLLGEEVISYAALRKSLQAFPADVRIGIIDSCTSGQITRHKGGTRRTGFMTGIPSDVRGMAFLTSSSASEPAQESDVIGGSYFTHALVSGLRGAADVDRDSIVTLSEAYRFAFDETLASTETTIGGAQHPAYEIQLAGTHDFVLTDLRAASATVEVAADIRGRLTLRDREGRLAAELDKRSGDVITLAVPEGRYQATVVSGDGAYRGEVRVGEGRSRLRRADLRAITRTEATARGDALGYRVVPFNLSLFPPVSINAIARPEKVENHASINLLAGASDRLVGVELGVGPNIVREDVRGVQAGVVGNYVGRDLRGIQGSVGFSAVGGTMTGVQHSFGVSHARAVQGVQLALVNVAGEVRGGQLGLVNIATRRVLGAQGGVINYAGDVSGASLGPVSVVKSGRISADVSTSDVSLVNVGLRLRGRNTYSLLRAGIYPLGERPSWSLGAALGGHVALTPRVHLDADAGWQMIHAGYRFDRQIDSLLQLRLMVGLRPRARFGVYGGPTFNVFVPTYDATILPVQPRGRSLRPGYGPGFLVAQGPRFHVTMWPGFVFGLEF